MELDVTMDIELHHANKSFVWDANIYGNVRHCMILSYEMKNGGNAELKNLHILNRIN